MLSYHNASIYMYSIIFFQDIFPVIITRLFIMISYSSLKENCFFKEIYILSNTSFEAGRFEKNMLKMLNIINIVQKYKWTPLYALLHGNFCHCISIPIFQFNQSIKIITTTYLMSLLLLVFCAVVSNICFCCN